jgi:hypothetical protein
VSRGGSSASATAPLVLLAGRDDALVAEGLNRRLKLPDVRRLASGVLLVSYDAAAAAEMPVEEDA